MFPLVTMVTIRLIIRETGAEEILKYPHSHGHRVVDDLNYLVKIASHIYASYIPILTQTVMH